MPQWILGVLDGAIIGGCLKIQTKQSLLRPTTCPILPHLTYFTTRYKLIFQTKQTQSELLWTYPSHLAKIAAGNDSFTISHMVIRTCLGLVQMFTLAGFSSGFIASQTLALAHGNHPFPLSCAVDLWGGMTDGILHADALHDCESICNRLREDCQALHRRWARLVVHPDRQQRHTSAHVLKSQVEALSG